MPDTRRPSQQWQATPPRGRPPSHPRGTQPPQGMQAKPGREEPGPDRPPPKHARWSKNRGRTRGGARTTWNGPTSAQCRDRAGCPSHTTQGGGNRTPRERERTHTRRARGDYQKGNRNELAELKPVRTPVAILGSLGVCIYVPASRHWLISYSPIHLT